MNIINNRSFSPDGELETIIPPSGLQSRSKVLLLQDGNGNSFEHLHTEVVKESSFPQIDQNLDAEDFQLRKLIQLGARLQSVTPASPLNEFEKADLLYSTVNELGNLPLFESIESAHEVKTPSSEVKTPSSEVTTPSPEVSTPS